MQALPAMGSPAQNKISSPQLPWSDLEQGTGPESKTTCLPTSTPAWELEGLTVNRLNQGELLVFPVCGSPSL